MENAVFFHIPKTGGTWVRNALLKGGIHFKEIPCNNCSTDADIKTCCFHAKYSDITIPTDRNRLQFAFVRHPVAYYKSFWAFKMCVGWNFKSKFEQTVASANFIDFAEAVIEHFPGWASHAFESYIGPEDSPYVDFVGKQENLRLDLLWALRRAGQPVDPEAILRLGLINQASILPEWRDECVYTEALEEAVKHVERKAMERFGYW